MHKSLFPKHVEQPDLRGLLALQRTCRLGSVSAAATDLAWSHSTLEHHLTKLERLLGTQLLERTPRGSRPTAAGRFVSEHADEILLLCDQLVSDVRAARHDSTSHFRCAMVPTVATRVVPEVKHLLDVQQEASGDQDPVGSRLEIVLDEISPTLTRVEQGKLDFALIIGDYASLASRKNRLRFELVCTEPVYLCVALDHPLVREYGTRLPPLHRFSTDRWAVGTEKLDPLDHWLMRTCADAGFSPLIGMKTNDYGMAQHFSETGLVITLVPAAGLDPEARTHRWKLPQHMLRREILLVTRKSANLQASSMDAAAAASTRRQELSRVIDEVRIKTKKAFLES